MKRFRSSPGFGLLLCVVVVGVTAAAMGVSLAYMSMREGDLSLGLIAAKQAEYIADACLEEAAYQLKANASYTGKASHGIGTDGTCAITVTGSNPFTVAITAQVGQYTRAIRATVTITTGAGTPPPPPTASVSQWTQVAE
jgi:hypothetical protein